MNAPNPLLNTLNGADGGNAQFEMLWAMISAKVKADMAQVQVLGSGVVRAQGGQTSTLLSKAHE
jgi:ethanolamine ammonia-lyase large subunit